MKSQKEIIFALQLEGDEVADFKEALEKIIRVESTNSANVMKLLSDKETKLLMEILKGLQQ